MQNPHPQQEHRQDESQDQRTDIEEHGWGNERRKEALRQYITGWLNYFCLADMKNLLERIDEWFRRRLRSLIWKKWKRIKNKLRKLIKLGIPKQKAWEYANTRKSFWRTAYSPILHRSITNDRLRKAGYTFSLTTTKQFTA